MRKILLTLISVTLGISLMAQNASALKLNLEKNKVYRLKSNLDQTITQTMNGIAQTTTVKSNTVVSLKMLDATPNFIVAEVRFDTISSNTNAMGNVIVINSAIEGDIKSTEMADVMSCIMNRLSKNALFVKMDYTGKVLEIVNLKMLTDIVVKDTASIAGQTAFMSKMQIKNTINDKSLKTMVEMFTNNLPGKEVAKGNKWDITIATNSGGMSMDIITNYQLDGLKDNTASISAESNIQTSLNAEPIDYGGAKITYGDIKGLGKSNMTIDTKTGLVIDNTSKTHISGNLSISAQGQNFQMPMDINMEAKVVALP